MMQRFWHSPEDKKALVECLTCKQRMLVPTYLDAGKVTVVHEPKGIHSFQVLKA